MALLLRFFLLAQESAERFLQVWFLILLAISFVSLALNCLEQGVLQIAGDGAT